jgi:hypothetical protein
VPRAKEFVDYLQSIPDWATFHIKEAKGNLHMLQTDNMVESCFSWVNDLRYHNTYHFTVLLLQKILFFHSKCAAIVRSQPPNISLTPKATIAFNEETLRSSDFTDITILDGGEKNRFSVKHINSHALSASFKVDLSERSCSCSTWVQMGVPCKHAIACLKFAHNGKNDRKLFFPWTLTSEWVKLYEIPSVLFHIPDEDDVALIKQQLAADGKDWRLLSPVSIIEKIEPSQLQKKRIRSAGESGVSLSSAVSVKKANGKQTRTCPYCKKVTALRTMHQCKLLSAEVVLE